MLKIRAVKIVVHAADQRVYGAEYRFADGLNIVRGDNSAGKSTLYHAILYGLGVEEILDGRNERALQSVLKEAIQYGGTIVGVLESTVYLELEAASVVTIRRGIAGGQRSPKLVEVLYGAAITGREPVTRVEPMYVHDKGGASDAFYGFHLFLQRFLGWELPTVIGSLGDSRSLYIQAVFPAFVIEQKRGWSDFLATVPYFGVKDSESRVLEFLLALDVTANRRRKQELQQLRQEIAARWLVAYNDLVGTAKRGGVEVQGVGDAPEILDESTPIVLSARHGGERKSLARLVSDLTGELAELVAAPLETSGDKAAANQQALREQLAQFNDLTLGSRLLADRIGQGKAQVEQYEDQLRELAADIEKNKGARKVYELGATEQVSTALLRCPTCQQEIKDTLMPQAVTQTPMRLEDNIAYLTAQQKMLELQLGIQRNSVDQDSELYEAQLRYLDELAGQVRTLQSELVADQRAPSEADIERRVKLKANINFLNKLVEELAIQVATLKDISREWAACLRETRQLPQDFFSVRDRQKLTAFEERFKALLARFGYSSSSLENVQISRDRYMPVIQSETVRYNIKTDSSATDLVRAIWAYTCALRQVSAAFGGHHPRLLLFDEPAQHSMSDENFTTFLRELAAYPDGQSFVFASFNNSDAEFAAITRELRFTLTRIEGKLIQPQPAAGGGVAGGE